MAAWRQHARVGRDGFGVFMPGLVRCAVRFCNKFGPAHLRAWTLPHTPPPHHITRAAWRAASLCGLLPVVLARLVRVALLRAVNKYRTSFRLRM